MRGEGNAFLRSSDEKAFSLFWKPGGVWSTEARHVEQCGAPCQRLYRDRDNALEEFCGWRGVLLDSQPGETPHGGCGRLKANEDRWGEVETALAWRLWPLSNLEKKMSEAQETVKDMSSKLFGGI